LRASSASFRIAVLFALAGIVMGIAMAASGDHSLMPAHAHVNLLGWVSLFLFGIYYRLRPEIDARRAAMVQVGVWSVGTAAMTVAVAGLHLGHKAFVPVASVSSLVVLAGIGLFAWLVFKAEARSRAPALEPAG
jgi:hypothetical protein